MKYYVLHAADPSVVILLGEGPGAQEEWLRWTSRYVELAKVGLKRIDGVTVSTKFIGYEGCLWETVIMGGHYDGYDQQYQTYAEACEGHAAWVSLVHYRQTHPSLGAGYADPWPADPEPPAEPLPKRGIKLRGLRDE